MDTWGIPSRAFLLGYLLLAIGSVLFAILYRRGTDRADHKVRLLTGPEIGMLTSEDNAIAAAMAQLRADGLVNSAGRHTDQRPGRLDPFTRATYNALNYGSNKLSVLRSHLAEPLRLLRASLVDAGLLSSPAHRRHQLFATLPVLIVLLIGIARVVAGVANGKPVLFLLMIIATLSVVLVLLWLPQRQTRLGNRTRQTMMRQHRALRPGNRPALAAYGGQQAGLAAALFGGAALWSLDPALARAASAAVITTTSSSIGYNGGSSCGGSSSSSCGGGGGSSCGGGGCGG